MGKDAGKVTAVPFAPTERVNDLRVALSSIKILARDGKLERKTLNAIHNAARHALERDLSRAQATRALSAGKDET
jgi:hypothetical protein